MLSSIFNIVAPVFLVVAAGYLVVRLKWFSSVQIDSLMRFAVLIAIPCLLFKATSTIDLASAYNWRMLLSYYLAAIVSFAVSYQVIHRIFSKRAGESVAAAFGALFSNLVLLGLPISELAWGNETMAPNFALVSINAPICYLIGITTMEYLRADGRSASETISVVIGAMFRNSLMIGIALGFLVNFGHITLPSALISSIDLLARASLPVALFALGGVLTRYAMSDSMGEAGLISILSLVLQPALTWWLAVQFDLDNQVTRSIVLMSAMAPGLNAYLFASMYNRSLDVASNTVMLATTLSVFSVSMWLLALQAYS